MTITKENAAETTNVQLTVFDIVCLIVGIVVGTAIFKAPPLIFSMVPSREVGLLMWGLGGILAMSGALCYCELATTYPRFGGEYVYLTEAYGPLFGFLFAWMQLCAIITGSIGAMAFVFADYAATILNLPEGPVWLAIPAVLVLTLIQTTGLKSGKLTQNLLTGIKVLSLGMILCAGVMASYQKAESKDVNSQTAITSTSEAETDEQSSLSWSQLGLALVFVLYAYGGWNDTAAVAPLVKDLQRNIPRGYLIGLSLITVLYLALNEAYLRVLGLEGIRAASAPAARVMSVTLGSTSSIIMSVIVMISALGAIHGMLFTASQTMRAVGAEHQALRWCSYWYVRNTPIASLLTLSAISVFLICLVGTEQGRLTVDMVTQACHVSPPDWEKYDGGFNTLVTATAPIFWGFFALAGVAVIVLRIRRPNQERPYRVPLYPILPLLFTATSLFMFYSSATYAGSLVFLCIPVVIAGIVAFVLERQESPSRSS